MQFRHLQVLIILAAYFALGSVFVLKVPAWETPDEPAHYNYVRQLTQFGVLPVIERGDYDQTLIQEKIAPPDKPIDFSLDAVQYQDHQPPLFYALSSPVFIASNGSLHALRLFSLALGSLAVVFCYLSVLAIFPDKTQIAALAAAFIALLPQRLFIMSGFNNDSLSEALIGAVVWRSVIWMRDVEAERNTNLHHIALSILVGLCFLTKAQAYLAFPVALFALFAARPNQNRFTDLFRFVLLACLIGAPLWIRNISLYGGVDFLGLQRHNLVVVGQPMTADWIATNGVITWLFDLVRVTFQSFWGMFGWMSAPMNNREYISALIFSLISGAMFYLWWLRRDVTERQSKQLNLLTLLALLTVLAFAWYNAQFVQRQGRYLFPALIPIATAVALAWTHLSSRWRYERWTWMLFTLGFIMFDVYVLLRVILPSLRY
jgi:hypothetical protein